ncbi:hypothetical protein BBJ28_00009411 [Nothophytophthora sp. Chile5]|nr:hypothetical protein BBJ28_00009411 [Nothophytophthora sp. Chile5]
MYVMWYLVHLCQNALVERSMSAGSDAFSVGQCVTKRSRQLERLLYIVNATAAKYHHVKCPPTCSDVAVLPPRARGSVQRKYGILLLEFLERERALQLPTLFAQALHLEVGPVLSDNKYQRRDSK